MPHYPRECSQFRRFLPPQSSEGLYKTPRNLLLNLPAANLTSPPSSNATVLPPPPRHASSTVQPGTRCFGCFRRRSADFPRDIPVPSLTWPTALISRFTADTSYRRGSSCRLGELHAFACPPIRYAGYRSQAAINCARQFCAAIDASAERHPAGETTTTTALTRRTRPAVP